MDFRILLIKVWSIAWIIMSEIKKSVIFKLKCLSSYSMSNVTLVEFSIKIKVLVKWELIEKKSVVGFVI